jgi:Tfp pilus assembly protein PilV
MNRRRFGFTILESALSLTVVTVGMLGLAGVFSQIVKCNAVIRQKQTAALLAGSKIAQLRLLSLAEMRELEGVFEKPFDDYSWQGQVICRPDYDNVYLVTVEVKYKGGAAVKLATLIFSPE